MQRSELEHLLRAAGEIIDERKIIVLARKVPNPEDDLSRAARIIRRIERLCANRERPQ